MSTSPSSGPGATLPVVIRTRAMRASSKRMPKKDRLASPGDAGTKLLNISLPSRSNYSISVLFPRGFARLKRGPIPSDSSTSVKMAPKPRTVAGWAPLVPGMKNAASVRLLPTGVIWRGALKVLNVAP